MHAVRRSLRQLVAPALAAASLAAGPAAAFPWMVRHSYASCAACHVDPSGAGQLTLYGRAQSDVLLRFRVTRPTVDEEVEPSPLTRFLWFVDLPEWLNLAGNVRGGAYLRPGTSQPVVPLVMATDLYATATYDRFVGHATLGVAVKRAEEAALFPVCDPAQSGGQCGAQVVGRELWLGAKFADEAVTVRAGRLNLPFGLRNNEHVSWVRQTTRTDVNTDQQTGVTASYNGEVLRGEVMGLLGNYSVGPDAYRERGYSAFAEYSLRPDLYVGLSTLIAHARADLSTGRATTRHAHGFMARWSPFDLLALLGELDLLVYQSPGLLDRAGFAALAQGDFELMQGLHLIATVEGMHQGDGAMGPSLGLWGSVAWYPVHHVEVRVDAIVRRLSSPGVAPTGNFSLLLQLHFFL